MPSSSTASNTNTETKHESVILKPVFYWASAVIIGLILISVILARLAGDQLTEAANSLNNSISTSVGWWYIIAVNIFVVFVLYVAFSKIGNIRLGRDDESPEFGTVSWFLMLFSAGMGIGLVFFGVAEPLSNYIAPAEAFGAEPLSDQAARDAVPAMMLQWGIHPWAIYSVVGLGLAYVCFRRGRPLSIRWLLEPLIGRQRVEGWIGHVIDIVAIVGTMFGVATSFGFGITQVMAGLEYLGWAENSNALVLILVSVVTLLAIWSVITGVHGGLKWLSNLNMSLAAVLALAVFILGPTLILLQLVPQNLGLYLSMLPHTATNSGAFSYDDWEIIWTVGYWGWWTSWAPFVGMFIARISRGRTIREFIVGALAAPTLVISMWFSIFGGAGIWTQKESGGIATKAADGSWTLDSNTALFQFFDGFSPVTAVILSVMAMVVVTFFFITSADSGSLVMDMIASGGATNTPTATRIYWALLEGLSAGILLVVGGDAALTALQTLSVATALPFSIIMVLACISLLKAFRHEAATMSTYFQVAFNDEGKVRTIGGGDASLIEVTHVPPSTMNFDNSTGAATGFDPVEDPLAGQVFDTPEYESSQEYLNTQRDE